MAKLSQSEAIALLGKDPTDVARELSNFSETARALSSSHPRLLDEHPQQWVALYDGNVEIFGDTLESVISQLNEKGYPKDKAMVRFIDKEERTFIL